MSRPAAREWIITSQTGPSAETPSPQRELALDPALGPDPVLGLDLETATVAELHALLDAGRATSVDLVHAYTRRIRALDLGGPALNSVRCLNPSALDEAAEADRRRAAGERGPLLGIPVLVKDNIDMAGLPTTAGSVALADSRPSVDAPLVAALHAAGAVILGKANLTEFANYMTEGMPSGYSSLAGQVLNPYDTSQTPSGSSSGSGVAAAAGFAAVTVGTETSGSILAPAQATSVVGVKPTVGLIPRTGIVPIAASQDTAGPMARTVADAAALLTILCGADPADPATEANPLVGHDFTADLRPTALSGARIGVVAHEVPAAGSDERTRWDEATAALAARGAQLVEVKLDEANIDWHSTVLNYEFGRDLDAYLGRASLATPLRSIREVAAFNAEHAGRALKFGQTLLLAAAAIDRSPDSEDTARYTAARAQDLADSRDSINALLESADLTALLFAGWAGAPIGAKAGFPSVSVPAGYLAANRRPFSIAFLGPAWSEPTLLGYAYDYEQATRLRRPPSQINPAVFAPRSL